jgi:hypothetical protein
MKQAFLKFNKGLAGMPVPARLWMFLLLAPANSIAPLFFLSHPEAWWVLGSFVGSVIWMVCLTAKSGFTRLLGLGHILWVPLLIYLWMRLGQIPATDSFGVWIRMLMVLNAVSLIADSIDVARYISGDRKETIDGLSV